MSILVSELTNHKSNIIIGNNLTEKQRNNILAVLKSGPIIAVGGLIIDNVTDQVFHIENLLRGYDNIQWCDSEIYHFEKYDARLDESAKEWLLKNASRIQK